MVRRLKVTNLIGCVKFMTSRVGLESLGLFANINFKEELIYGLMFRPRSQ